MSSITKEKLATVTPPFPFRKGIGSCAYAQKSHKLSWLVKYQHAMIKETPGLMENRSTLGI
jgi:hypothetical protein